MLKLFQKTVSCCVLLLAWAFVALASEEDEREGGITGTGIVGEITALGSIIVNGQRVSFDPGLTVASVVTPKQADDLVPGDVVAVAVSPQDDGWQAEAISQIYPLVGPVSETGDAEFTVLGVKILWPGLVPSVGDWVAISGFWAHDTIIATRVQGIKPQGKASVQGSYHLAPSDGAVMVGGLRVSLPPLQHAQDGDVVRVSGPLENDVLQVSDVHLGLFSVPVSLVLAEGYLSDVDPSGHYTVSGSGLSAFTDNPMAPMTADRVIVCGVNGELKEPGQILEDAVAQRLGC